MHGLGIVRLGVLIALLILSGVARADGVVLTLRNPQVPGAQGSAALTLDDLRAMSQHEIATSTDFTDGVATFRGPRAAEVIERVVRLGSNRVRMTAANEFFVEIEIEELQRYGAILALSKNGKALSRRDKGPIWMMYPLDDHAELQDPAYNNRLIWQVVRIELL